MNVFVFVYDSLRADFLTPYSQEIETSPNLRDFSSDSLVFEKAISQSTWTRPSGTSILSSTYPTTHRVETPKDTFPQDLPTLAEEFSDAGFETVAISAMGNISPELGFDKGFDKFIELYKDKSLLEDRVTRDNTLFMKNENFELEQVPIPTGEDINIAIEEVLESHDQFVFIWSIDTHDPYYHRDKVVKYSDEVQQIPLSASDVSEAETETEREKLRNIYQDMIYYADIQFGNFIDILKRENIYDESILVVTGDHGEAFGEHGQMSHAGKPYDEQIHVPLLMKVPEQKLVENVDNIVETIDIYPTILELADVSPTSKFIQGERLCMDSQLTPSKDIAFSTIAFNEGGSRHWAVRTPTHKYVRSRPPLTENSIKDRSRRFRYRLSEFSMRYSIIYYIYLILYSNTKIKKLNTNSVYKLFDLGTNQKFYNLDSDPNEQKPIYEKSKMAELRDYLFNHLASCNSLASSINVAKKGELSSEIEEQLEAMGYID